MLVAQGADASSIGSSKHSRQCSVQPDQQMQSSRDLTANEEAEEKKDDSNDEVEDVGKTAAMKEVATRETETGFGNNSEHDSGIASPQEEAAAQVFSDSSWYTYHLPIIV